MFLSYVLDETTPLYGGKKGITKKEVSRLSKGDTANTSEWILPNHSGTHIDFPSHFYEDGQTIDDFPEKYWQPYTEEEIQLLKCTLPKKENLIKINHLEKNRLNRKAKIILLKTGMGKKRTMESYWQDNPGISMELARWIRKTFNNVRMIGIDSISISSWKNREMGRRVHRYLLDPKKPILLIEDMKLQQMETTEKVELMAIAPLRVRKTNGTPCTIYIKEKNGGI